MQKDKGILLILSGPSGTGKSTVISALSQLRDDIRFSVSATTRRPRSEDIEGKTYYFRTREEFLHMVEEDAFLEYAEYVGNYYGTPAAPVDAALEAGYTVILDIEVQGAAQVMVKRPDAVSVFLCPPSLQELRRRLQGRGTDTEETIRRRLAESQREYSQIHKYRYIVVNEDVNTAVRELDAVITAEKCRCEKRIQYVLEGDALL